MIWPAVALIAIFAASPARPQTNGTADLQGGLRVLQEALAKIQEHAFKPPPPGYLVQEAVRSYLRRFDPYADYLTALEYAAYQKAKNSDYGGVGMDLVTGKKGEIVCRPFSGSPAEKAGISSGDLLLAVDGKPASGRSVYLVGAAIRGEPGSRVTLLLRDREGREKKAAISRSSVSYRSVSIEEPKGKPIISVRRFVPATPAELKETLQTVGRGRPKVIDLRGNSGGDLAAAREAAAFFLQPGQKIMDLKTNKATRSYLAQDEPLDKDSQVILWQDQQTASAAEVFIAALTQNKRAVSLGRRSFGKGVAQRIIRMSDGAALILTHALILPPKGRSYHATGLEPDRPLQDSSLGAFLHETTRLLKPKPKRMIIRADPGGVRE